MSIQLSIKRYRRPFASPIHTHHGVWKIREGWLLRLENGLGNSGFGEVAPIPWFNPQETFENIAAKLESFPATLPDDFFIDPSVDFPSVAFGLESAFHQLTDWEMLKPQQDTLFNAQLLPAGLTAAIDAIHKGLEAGYTVFKKKIAIEPIEAEFSVCEMLLHELGPKGTLRLDANGGLDPEQTQAWLSHLASSNVEFIEQPMPPGNEISMSNMASNAKMPIALDESINTLSDAQTHIDTFPKGLFVIKPSILGSPTRWIKWRQQFPALKVVYSSCFETAIGYQSGLQLAASDPFQNETALGFGTPSFFPEDRFQPVHRNHAICLEDSKMETFESIWNQL